MKTNLRRFAIAFAACCLVSCDSAEIIPALDTLPATDIPFGSLPDSTQDVRNLVTGNQIPGIKTQFVGSAENTLLVLEIDTAIIEPVLLGRPNKGISARHALLENDFSAVIGSGFVSELQTLKPVGLLQIDGQTLNPLQGHGYTRILGINDTGIGVVHREAYHRNLFHSALQAGPGIIEQGRLDISERDLQRPKYFRSFVATCKTRWLAGVSLAPSHLRTLGQTLLGYINAQHLQCSDVVNLAGDREAVMLLRGFDKTIVYHGDPDTHKVSLLGFRALPPPGTSN